MRKNSGRTFSLCGSARKSNPSVLMEKIQKINEGNLRQIGRESIIKKKDLL
jgi:hypothetical protein